MNNKRAEGKEFALTFDCFKRWSSCPKKKDGDCVDSESTFEGKFVLNSPNANGLFTGTFKKQGSETPQPIIGRCSDSSPNLVIVRLDSDLTVHVYSGDKFEDKHVHGRHRSGKANVDKMKFDGDDDWVGTHTT